MMLILEKGTYMPTQRALSGLVVFPSTLVLLTLEQTDARALEPTVMKIKMLAPSNASIVATLLTFREMWMNKQDSGELGGSTGHCEYF